MEPAGDAANIGSSNSRAGAGSTAEAAHFQQALALSPGAAHLQTPGADRNAVAKQGKAALEPGVPHTEKKPANAGQSPEPTNSAGAGNPVPNPATQVVVPELPLLLVPMAMPLAPTGPALPATHIAVAGDHAPAGSASAVAAVPVPQGVEAGLPLPVGPAHPALGKSPQAQNGEASGPINSKPGSRDAVPATAAHSGPGKVAIAATTAAESAQGESISEAGAGNAKASSAATGVEQPPGSLLAWVPAAGAGKSSADGGTTAASTAAPGGTGGVPATNASPVLATPGAAQNPANGTDAQAQSGSGGAKQAGGDGQVVSGVLVPSAESFAAAVVTQGLAGAGAVPMGGSNGTNELVASTATQHGAGPQAAASPTPTELPALQMAQGGAINTARVLETMNGTEMRVGIHSADFGSVSIAATVSPSGVAAQIALEHGALGQALSTHLAAIEEKLGTTLGLSARVEMHSPGSAMPQGNSDRAPGGNGTAAGDDTSASGSAGGGRSHEQASGVRIYTAAALEPVDRRPAVTAAGRLSVQA